MRLDTRGDRIDRAGRHFLKRLQIGGRISEDLNRNRAESQECRKLRVSAYNNSLAMGHLKRALLMTVT